MLQPNFLQFLYELSQNNNRDWFEQNKKRYESDVKKPFEGLVSSLIRELQSIDPIYNDLDPKRCIFRIYRDTRFSKDKTPYKTHVSASFSPGAKGMANHIEYPGFYLQIAYGMLMIGGGAYSPEKDTLHKIRTAILQDPEGYNDAVNSSLFLAKYPDGLIGERNKILPPEFKQAAASNDALYQKQFYFMAELDPEMCLQPDCSAQIGAYFKAAQAPVDFLKHAIFSVS